MDLKRLIPGIPDIFLYGNGAEQGQQEGEGIEPLFTRHKGGIPQAYDQQKDRQNGSEPAEALLKS
jgi:hypothetical protein